MLALSCIPSLGRANVDEHTYLHKQANKRTSEQANKQTDVARGTTYHKDLDIHFLAKINIGEDEDAFDQEYSLGMYEGRDLRAAVRREIVIGQGCAVPSLELADVLHQQRGVQAIGMVEVDLAAFFDRLGGQVLVVMIVGEVYHVGCATQLREEPSREGGFAGACSACDSEGDHRF